MGPGVDRLFQDVVQRAEEFDDCLFVQSRDLRCGMQAGAEKNFIRVNVSDTGEKSLVQQCRFHRALMVGKQFRESREIDRECVHTKPAARQEFIHVVDQSDFSKHALIVEGELEAFLEGEQHARVQRHFFLALEIAQRASHAEMQSQPRVAIDAHKQMFAMAATRFETPAE
jgi:hypothetical protein